jgi:hypothetical protein
VPLRQRPCGEHAFCEPVTHFLVRHCEPTGQEAAAPLTAVRFALS